MVLMAYVLVYWDTQDQHAHHVLLLNLYLFDNSGLDIYLLLLKDTGCNTGGSLSCSNGGTCQPNGLCECPLGYTGLTCSKCKYITALLSSLTR